MVTVVGEEEFFSDMISKDPAAIQRMRDREALSSKYYREAKKEPWPHVNELEKEVKELGIYQISGSRFLPNWRKIKNSPKNLSALAWPNATVTSMCIHHAVVAGCSPDEFAKELLTINRSIRNGEFETLTFDDRN